MEFSQEDQISPMKSDLVFKYSGIADIVVFIFSLAGTVGTLFYGIKEDWRILFASLMFFLFFIFTTLRIRATHTSANWLMIIRDQHLFIKFRSHLNHHFSKDDPVIINLSFSEISWVQKSKITRKYDHQTTNSSGERYYTTIDETLDCLDIHLQNNEDLIKLQDQLNNERSRQSTHQGTSWAGLPVSIVLEPQIIRIEWAVATKIDEVIPVIKKSVMILPSNEELFAYDYESVYKLDEAEQEKKIQELIEMGDMIKARALQKRLGGTEDKINEILDKVQLKLDL